MIPSSQILFILTHYFSEECLKSDDKKNILMENLVRISLFFSTFFLLVTHLRVGVLNLCSPHIQRVYYFRCEPHGWNIVMDVSVMKNHKKMHLMRTGPNSVTIFTQPAPSSFGQFDWWSFGCFHKFTKPLTRFMENVTVH